MENISPYYNEEYAPIHDDYVEAERRAKLDSQEEVNADSTVRNQTNKSKRQSRYDDEGYALPDYDENSSSPSSEHASFQQDNISVSARRKCKKGLHCLSWKRGMLFLTVIGIGVGSGVAIYLVMAYRGKIIVIS